MILADTLPMNIFFRTIVNRLRFSALALKDSRICADIESRNSSSCGNRMTIIKFVAPLIHASFLCVEFILASVSHQQRASLLATRFSLALFDMIAFQRVTLGFNSRLDYSRHYRVSSQRMRKRFGTRQSCYAFTYINAQLLLLLWRRSSICAEWSEEWGAEMI
jgi:hypothetical protein